jgi:hypothetical protein
VKNRLARRQEPTREHQLPNLGANRTFDLHRASPPPNRLDTPPKGDDHAVPHRAIIPQDGDALLVVAIHNIEVAVPIQIAMPCRSSRPPGPGPTRRRRLEPQSLRFRNAMLASAITGLSRITRSRALAVSVDIRRRRRSVLVASVHAVGHEKVDTPVLVQISKRGDHVQSVAPHRRGRQLRDTDRSRVLSRSVLKGLCCASGPLSRGLRPDCANSPCHAGLFMRACCHLGDHQIDEPVVVHVPRSEPADVTSRGTT